MRLSRCSFSWLPVLLIAFGTVEARAADSGELSQALALAETAYEQVDFGATYKLACKGLKVGNATVQQTLRLHLLCAIASAALDKGDEARDHFKIALAIRPELHLDRELSPKIRGPYLEAQGDWFNYEDRLALKSTSRSNEQRIQLKVIDPSHLSSSLRLAMRRPGQDSFRTLDRESLPVVIVDTKIAGAGDGLEYYASLVDEYGNAIADLGSETEPLEIHASRLPILRSTRPEPVARQLDRSESRSPWLPITLVGAGAASAGAGVYFNVLRQNAAHKWNGPECENPGLTRAEQCSAVGSDRRNAERAAISFYAAGGLLLTAGVTIWAIQGSSHSRAQTADGPQIVCATGSPLSFSCSGRF